MYRILPCLYSCTGALLVAVSQEADKDSAWLLHLLKSSNVDQQPNCNTCSSVNLPINQQQLQGQQQQQQQHQQLQQQQQEGWQQTWQWQQQQQHQNWQKSWQWQQQQQQLKQQGWWRWPNVHACQGRLVAHLLHCPGTASLLLPFRQFSSSSASLGKRHTAAWPQQPPVLHQPAQHLTGAGPAQPLQNSHLIMQLPSTTSQRLADAGMDGSTSSSKSTFSSRLKAAAGRLQAYLQTGVQKLQPSLARAWPFVAFIILSMSGSYCIYLAPRYVMLLSAASLRSPEPVLQIKAIRRLSSVLWLYQQVTEMGSWPPAAGDLMEQWLLQALVMLVRPDADAGVLAELFAFLQRLLDYDRNVKKALRQAGMLAALNAGLQQGWLPSGALDAAKVLQRDLQ